MTNSGRHVLRLTWLAFGLNAAAAAGCVALIAVAPDRAGAWLAVGGLVFFVFAAGGFATMLRLRLAAR